MIMNIKQRKSKIEPRIKLNNRKVMNEINNRYSYEKRFEKQRQKNINVEIMNSKF